MHARQAQARLPAITLGDVGATQLASLCRALGRNDLVSHGGRVFGLLSATWAHRDVNEPPPYSDLTDDCSPYEFSLAFEQGRPDVRFLVEAQGTQVGLQEQWQAGVDLTQQLALEYGATTRRLQQVAPLFQPSASSEGRFALWHGVTLRSAEQAPEFKAYLNPTVHGRASARDLVDQALRAIGLSEAADLMKKIMERSGSSAWPGYFCVDLLDGEASRAKVYVAHPDATAADVKRALQLASNLHEDDVDSWCSALVGETHRFDQRPLLSCYAFTAASAAATGTLHIPARCYVDSDQVLFERILRTLDGESQELYRSAVRALATRTLAARTGFQTYVSLRRARGVPRTTVYLAPELYTR